MALNGFCAAIGSCPIDLGAASGANKENDEEYGEHGEKAKRLTFLGDPKLLFYGPPNLEDSGRYFICQPKYLLATPAIMALNQ